MSQYSNRNKLVVPGAKNAINQMKYEIANELGVNLGPEKNRSIYQKDTAVLLFD